MIAAVIVAALYFGRDLLVPLALAILLSFILAPLVQWLRRWHVSRLLSVVLAVLLAVSVFVGLGTVLAHQATRLTAELPRYEFTIRNKAQRLQGLFSQTGVVESASAVIKGVSKELEKPGEEAPAPSRRAQEEPPRPVPVEVHQRPPTPVETARSLLEPLLKPLAIGGIVIVFVVFILLQREDLRDRIIRLFGTRDLQRTTAALDDAAYRLSRYFLTQLALNTASGVVIAAGLFVIGVPSAALWGIVAMIMRFVPYVGAFIAAAGPALLAIAVDPGWSMALWTIALFAVAEPFMGQVIEPWVYGHSTGVSSLAIIVAATFWTLLWGPVGLLLSTPLTVCLVVLGRHVRQLQFLDVLLGDRPALAPEQTFYQRLLAGDPIEIVDQAEACLETRPLVDYYDSVAVKGLTLAHSDLRNGLLAEDAQARILKTVGDVIDDLTEHLEAAAQTPSDEAHSTATPHSADIQRADLPKLRPPDLKPEWAVGRPPVLCVAVTSVLDEAAAAMLAQILQTRGIRAHVSPWAGLAGAQLRQLDLRDVKLICLSTLDSAADNTTRHLVRRLRRLAPDVTIIAGFWAAAPAPALPKPATGPGPDLLVTSLRDAVDQILKAARHESPAEPGKAAE